ncbi:D-alanyl-D-alanine carboxypeptidase [[Bacillus] enclensis]|jgi:serine-type D-Ala-D-Ala carboxypeptidase (penicillin-binding protein 5/6)|uniref:serine-type D-Ala-D-Ala carboxypeptidase n=1 Tax=[Bacillus] enclensis TaxID=1402860 RepID=A0A0V8HLV1_9BACI|nr:D-alanyl-D-alanine carboxypeptidase family protein [[Bacillus] enclensis]OAT84093.1 D-alanyl-D-alanine carboxypeptidase [Bacillus sp. MKU004]QTC43389.1 D-alanyl-D-alanine carboxypeptidase [Bacillus sp. V3]QWC21556.1 D-alanyl-D-alanine carboxypeptidase [Bacillus haikouensis]KSU63532.1 D-alanyl-D-alanine carboxypeptidase [[Bacillus] enclensis]MBH9968352.1 D-alanyl-D-alanine carboxypeptidase [[Bacillus] enclensis]
MKRVSCIMAAFILIASLFPSLGFAQENKSELAQAAKSAVLIERDTGAVLYDKNSHERLAPASMTKIMTMLLIMEALENGQIKWDDKVRTSEYAASMGGSQIFLEPGESMTVKEMLTGIAIGSANDASVAMAEHIAGSEEAFVEKMNKKAKEIGLKDTQFQNPTGLPAKDHYSSAHDMSMMAKELLKYNEITKFTGTYESYLRENTENKFWLVNTNKLVRFYDGVDGLKTGFTNEAKYCLTATAKKGNMRVIAVVFGASTPKERNSEVTKMLDYAFNQYQTKPMFKKGEQLSQVKVSKGQESKVQAVTDEPISILAKKGEKLDKVEQKVTLSKDLKAPVKKGDKVGTLVIKNKGKKVLESELVAKQDVNEASWWQLFKRSFGMFTKVGN